MIWSPFRAPRLRLSALSARMTKTTAAGRIATAPRSLPPDAAFDGGSAPAVGRATRSRARRSLVVSSAPGMSRLPTFVRGCSPVVVRGRMVRASLAPLRCAAVGSTGALAFGERPIRCVSRERGSRSWRPASKRPRLPSASPTSTAGRLAVAGVPAPDASAIADGRGSGAGDEMGAGGGGAGSGTEAGGVSAIGGVGAAEAGGAGAGGAAGAGGGVGAARGGSKDSGSTYVSSSPTRTPRWTYGTSCSGTPVGPASASGALSVTCSPRFTRSGPRWVNETLWPSVSIVTVSPCVGT
ncbi:hypothetical protein BH20ACT13_BH20ACT13_02370 [soil metagenome]